MIVIDADWVKERTILHAVYSSVIGLLLVIIVLAILRCRRQNNKGNIFRIFATTSLHRIPPSENKCYQIALYKNLLNLKFVWFDRPRLYFQMSCSLKHLLLVIR